MTGDGNMKERSIEFGYVAALSMILTAIIYFFAANWAGFDKGEKVVLSLALLALFYGSAFLFSMLFKRRLFISELCLFAGGVMFGVTAALIGQVYNSHADSYMLFAVWAIPALAFSIVTKYQPFYVLTYVLVHAGTWLFLFPSSGFQLTDEYWYRSFFAGTALANMLLFILIEKEWVRSAFLSFLSAAVFHIMMLILSTGEWFDFFPSVMSGIYIAVLGSWGWHIVQRGEKKSSTVLLGLALTLFLIIKFITFLIFVGSEYIFFLTSFFPVILVGAAVWALSRWGGRLKGNPWLKRVFIGMIAGVASVMGASSIAGILLLFMGEVPSSIFVILAVFALILPAVLKTAWDPVVRHTLLLTGYLIGIPAAAFSHFGFALFLIGVLAAVFLLYSSKAIQYMTYFAAIATLTTALLNAGAGMEETFLLLLLVNVLLLAARGFLQEERKAVLYHNGYIYGFLAFFVLTFLFENVRIVYFTVNGLYFVFTSLFLFQAVRTNRPFEYKAGLLFWFAYLAYKYYDVLWSLLHKSLTFLLIGLLLLWITKRYDRFAERGSPSIGLVRSRWLPILAIIVIQFGIAGVQVVQNEALLADGKTIRLPLEPVDPRSLLQGDYVILRYSVSTLTLEPEPAVYEKVSVELTPNDNGVYEYSGAFVKGRAPQHSSKTGVWMTGRYKGNGQIEYGIENYFVSEGTGRELEERAKHAVIKVSESGDALLLSLD
jgi:uncharacterized membrane-anchored protein